MHTPAVAFSSTKFCISCLVLLFRCTACRFESPVEHFLAWQVCTVDFGAHWPSIPYFDVCHQMSNKTEWNASFYLVLISVLVRPVYNRKIISERKRRTIIIQLPWISKTPHVFCAFLINLTLISTHVGNSSLSPCPHAWIQIFWNLIFLTGITLPFTRKQLWIFSPKPYLLLQNRLPCSSECFFFPSFSVLVHSTYIRGTCVFFLWKIASERKHIIIQLIYWTLMMRVLCLFLLNLFLKRTWVQIHVSLCSKTSNKKRATLFCNIAGKRVEFWCCAFYHPQK